MNPAELAATLDAVALDLRGYAEASFKDTFTAYSHEWAKVDGLDELVEVEQGTTPGKIPNKQSSGDASSARTVTIGDVERTVIEGGLHLPWAASPQVGWEYVLTAVGPTTHPSMLGRRYRVVETHPTSRMTAWRLDVVEVSAAEEA